ncbi:MAG: hypothetical protein U1F77_07545 [Kiritimatiellia bacterium]
MRSGALNGGLLEYKAPPGSVPRPANGKPDLGAVEWRSKPPPAADAPPTAPAE